MILIYIYDNEVEVSKVQSQSRLVVFIYCWSPQHLRDYTSINNTVTITALEDILASGVLYTVMHAYNPDSGTSNYRAEFTIQPINGHRSFISAPRSKANVFPKSDLSSQSQLFDEQDINTRRIYKLCTPRSRRNKVTFTICLGDW